MSKYTDEELWKLWTDGDYPSVRAMCREHGLPRTKTQERLNNYAKNHGYEKPGGKPGPQEKRDGFTEDFDGEKIEEEFDVNYRSASYTGKRIISIEDLIKACDIDLSVWQIIKPRLNKWEVGRKAQKKNIVYTDGKKDGFDQDDGTIFVEPLFQVRIELERIKPLEVFPQIQPVKINCTFENLPVKSVSDIRKNKIKKALILPDPQIGFKRDMLTGALDPFHDREAMSIALQIAKDNDFDKIVWNGDFLDMTEWSDKFVTSPEFYFTTQPALLEGSWWLSQFKQADPDAEHEFEPGNHEDRARKLIISHARAAYGLRPATRMQEPAVLSIEGLLGLDDLGIKYISDYVGGEVWLNDGIKIIHGENANAAPGSTARKILDNVYVSVVFGHIHSRELLSKTIYERGQIRTITVCCPGCLCRVDGVVPGVKEDQQWQQGIAVVYYDDNGWSDIRPIPITDHAVFEGQVYEPSDITGQLRQDVKWAGI